MWTLNVQALAGVSWPHPSCEGMLCLDPFPLGFDCACMWDGMSVGVCLYVHDEGTHHGLWVEAQLSSFLLHYMGIGDQAQLPGLVTRAFLFLLSHHTSPSSSFSLFIFFVYKAQEALRLKIHLPQPSIFRITCM